MNNLKIGDIIELEIFSELCCEICWDVIHNHVNCPVCKDEYASTDAYCNLDDWEKDSITCQCGASFRKVDKNMSWYDIELKAEILTLNKK